MAPELLAFFLDDINQLL